MKAWLSSLCLGIALLFCASLANAHGTRSVTIELTEVSPGNAIVDLRTTRPEDTARVELDAPCVTSPGEEDGDRVTTVTCPGGLAGRHLHVEGLGPIVSEAIVVGRLASGERFSKVLTVDQAALDLPATQTQWALAKSYVRLGMTHILTGYDHLLFLLALVVLLKKPRAILLAETAFTLSHSLSFSATALGLVRVSAPAAEAAIALSLVLVALDIGEREGETAQKGAALAFVFGLVHGLGFAGGLFEVGLPDHDVSIALLGFAGGVEIGQVAFLFALIGLFALLARFSAESRIRSAHPLLARFTLEVPVAVVIGTVGSSWLIGRTLSCFSGV